jgi:hypothetical protein
MDRGIILSDKYAFPLPVGSLIAYDLTHELLLMANWKRSRR